MAITNQQIMDYLEGMSRRQHDEHQALTERVGRLEVAFNEHLLEGKNGQADTGRRLSLVEQNVTTHQRNWDKVWRYGVGIAVSAIIGAVLVSIGLGVIP